MATIEEVKADLQAQIDGLQEQLDALGNNATIPFDIGNAMKARILIDAGVVSLSNKGSTTENISVNEAGVASHTVLGAPDGYFEVTLNGTVRYIPYFL